MTQKKKRRKTNGADKCDHSLSYKSTMRTIETTSEFYVRECSVCGGREQLARYKGSTNNLLLRNSFRTRYAGDKNLKDIIQPYQGEKANKDFAKAYPDKAKDYYTQKELDKMGMDKIKSQKEI